MAPVPPARSPMSQNSQATVPKHCFDRGGQGKGFAANKPPRHLLATPSLPRRHGHTHGPPSQACLSATQPIRCMLRGKCKGVGRLVVRGRGPGGLAVGALSPKTNPLPNRQTAPLFCCPLPPTTPRPPPHPSPVAHPTTHVCTYSSSWFPP